MNEQWKKVGGYNYYEVSNLGRVRSLDRELRVIWGGKEVIKYPKGKMLKPALHGPIGKQYYAVTLYSEEQVSSQCKIHHLVASAFLTDDYFVGAIVNHKNFDKLDNRAENLEGCTYSQNNKHARDKYGMSPKMGGVGSKHPRAKLTEKDVLEIRRIHAIPMCRLKKGKLMTKLEARFEIKRGCLNSIVFRKTWKHI